MMTEKEKADFEQMQNQLNTLANLVVNLSAVAVEHEKRIDMLHEVIVGNIHNQTVVQ